MSEAENGGTQTPERRDPRLKNLRPPWPKGVSGNVRGRPRKEPRVRRLARRHTREALKVLLELARSAQNEETRRRAALALLHEGWGPPPTTQEVIRPDAPLINITTGSGGAVSVGTGGTDGLYREAMKAGADLDAIIAMYDERRRHTLPAHGVDAAVVDGEVVQDRGAAEKAAPAPPGEAE